MIAGRSNPTSMTTSTQWNDTDGDGFGDNYDNVSWSEGRTFGQFVEGATQLTGVRMNIQLSCILIPKVVTSLVFRWK